MKRYVWTIGGKVKDGLDITQISTLVKEKLHDLDIWYFAEMGLIKPTSATYEYTYQANFPKTAVSYIAEKLREVFDLVIWREMSLEEYIEWNKVS